MSSKKVSGEDVVKIMNENPELFSAILGQPDVSGVIFILPEKDPVEVKKENSYGSKTSIRNVL